MKIYLISDNHDTIVGMRLGGIKGVIAKDKREAEEFLEEILRDKGVGIILISEKLGDMLRNRINYIKQKMPSPLIVEIPDRHGSIKTGDYITGYIRDSIGIKI